MAADDDMLWTESRVNSKDLQPAVVFRWADKSFELTPNEARTLGLTIIETAEAAEHDAALVRFLIGKLDVDRQAAVATLSELRVFRGLT